MPHLVVSDEKVIVFEPAVRLPGSCAKALADASLQRDHEWRVKLP
jgi:hypothetical protein